MTSTHTGNPVCAAAALACLKKIVDEDLAGNALSSAPYAWSFTTMPQRAYLPIVLKNYPASAVNSARRD